MDTLNAGAFCTAALSCAFLERYAAQEIPVLTHDEIRMPTFATAFGMNVHDTNVTVGNPCWNCEKAYYTLEQVHKAHNENINVFHPVREYIPLTTL
jgi:hypothetical protein